MKLNLIAAVSRSLVIGCNGQIPWRIPADLKRFKALTLGHPVIMGRKTWESLAGPLSDRLNCVISKTIPYPALDQHWMVFRELSDCLVYCRNLEYTDAFAIGGSRIYADSAPHATRLYLTVVDGEYAGDAFFPAIIPGDWREVEREDNEGYNFRTLDRVGDGEFDVAGYVNK